MIVYNLKHVTLIYESNLFFPLPAGYRKTVDFKSINLMFLCNFFLFFCLIDPLNLAEDFITSYWSYNSMFHKLLCKIACKVYLDSMCTYNLLDILYISEYFH